MSPRPFIALADDLTGAAEIAAIGHRLGLRTTLVTHGVAGAAGAELLVVDTDTRLCPPARAAARIEQLLHAWQLDPASPVFKKTDSVLRGAVAAEVTAVAAGLGRSRVLLVPANPSLGRVVREGVYFVNGLPLANTAFAHDPHHPAASSSVVALLGADPPLAVASLPPETARLPAGIVVGDAARPADLETWASRVSADTLPAGGAEFFAAWLRHHGCLVRPAGDPIVLPSPTFVVSGSVAPAARARVAGAAASRLAIAPLPEQLVAAMPPPAILANFADSVAEKLNEHQFVISSAAHITAASSNVSDAIRHAFASVVVQLRQRRAFSHLVVEGGATAAALVRALAWTELTVVHEWTPGVVTLRPAAAPEMLLTLKPGSYAWPEALDRALGVGRRSAATSNKTFFA